MRMNSRASRILACAALAAIAASVDGACSAHGSGADSDSTRRDSAQGSPPLTSVAPLAPSTSPTLGGVITRSSYSSHVVTLSVRLDSTFATNPNVPTNTRVTIGLGTSPTPPTPTPTPPIDTTPGPTPPPSGVTPFYDEHFTQTSVAQLQAIPNRWAASEAKNTDRISFVSGGGMRYNYPANGAKCLDYGVRPGQLTFADLALRSVWVEFEVSWDPSFNVNANASGCAAEQKLASLGDLYGAGVTGRWDFEMQANQFNWGYPGGPIAITTAVKPSTLWNGAHHVFRWAAGLGQGTGFYRSWVDGTLLVNASGLTTDPTHKVISAFAPTLNLNQGPATSTSMTWWRVTLYSKDPGWGTTSAPKRAR